CSNERIEPDESPDRELDADRRVHVPRRRSSLDDVLRDVRIVRRVWIQTPELVLCLRRSRTGRPDEVHAPSIGPADLELEAVQVREKLRVEARAVARDE